MVIMNIWPIMGMQYAMFNKNFQLVVPAWLLVNTRPTFALPPGAKTGYVYVGTNKAYLIGVSSVLLADSHTLHKNLEVSLSQA
jgi:hypothetical protein